MKGILWDNDGVLVDTERLFYEANRELFRGFGIELTEQHFLDWYLRDNCGAWHLAPQLTHDEIARHRAQRDQRYSERLAREAIPAMPGVDEVLAALAERVPMGVVTSSTPEHFAIVHDRLDLRRHFRFVLTHADYAHSKPSPEPYLLGLDRLGIAAADCVVVEDSPRGLQAARAAGIRCVILRHPLMRDHDFDGAWRVVETMAQLRETLLQLA